MRTKAWLAILVVVLATLLFLKLGDAGNRRNIEGWMVEGIYTHFTLLDPGECDANGCVMDEKEIRAFDGHNWIHQFIDTDGDDVCDERRIWKPLVDPKWGTYYKLHRTTSCVGAI